MFRNVQCGLAVVVLLVAAATSQAAKPIDIGSRLELMVDNYLIENTSGLRLVLHKPTKREVAVVHDAPWEGSNCCYHTVFRDGDIYRMYYLSAHNRQRPEEPVSADPLTLFRAAYAESKDGIRWVKPKLGLIEFAGSKKNNFLWGGIEALEGFGVFKDSNPNCKPEERYKALVCGGKSGVSRGSNPNQNCLRALKSSDGIHWFPLVDKAVMTKGDFDSLNLAFWDTVRGEYRAYFRVYRSGSRLRDIRTATSRDFVHWTEPVWLEYPGAPPEQLYTNAISPYYRAPHIFLGFPMRYVNRGWTESLDAFPELKQRKQRAQISLRFGTAITDGLFMSSRDGVTFKRWGEAFLRPGSQELGRWIYGDQLQNWGIVETKSDLAGAPNELSIYAQEGSWWGKSSNQLRRYTIRIDGFVSLQAPLAGGEFTTKPLVFSGDRLVINYSTSAAGSIRVEVQAPDGKPLDGFRLTDCPEIFGDSLERTVAWKGGADVSKLAGRPVRLRFVMKDADLYSLRFQ